jgi:hypothetical protein
MTRKKRILITISDDGELLSVQASKRNVGYIEFIGALEVLKKQSFKYRGLQ